MWWLGMAGAAAVGGATVGWAVRQRMQRALAVEADRRARAAAGHRAEVAQLRRGRPDVVIAAAAAAVVDNALRGASRRGVRR